MFILFFLGVLLRVSKHLDHILQYKIVLIEGKERMASEHGKENWES